MLAFILYYIYEPRVISPPQMIANKSYVEIKQVTSYARDVEVLMRSTVSTCP
jgi:hypothetical protein